MDKRLKYLTSIIVLILILCTSCVANAAFTFVGESKSGLKSITDTRTVTHKASIGKNSATFTQKVYFSNGWYYKDYNTKTKKFFPSAGGVNNDKSALYKESKDYQKKFDNLQDEYNYVEDFSHFRFKLNLDSLIKNRFLYCVRHDLHMYNYQDGNHIYGLSAYNTISSKSAKDMETLKNQAALAYAVAGGKEKREYRDNPTHQQDEAQKAVWGLYFNNEVPSFSFKSFSDNSKLAQIAIKYGEFIAKTKEDNIKNEIKYGKGNFEVKEETNQYVIGPFIAEFPYNHEETISYYDEVKVGSDKTSKSTFGKVTSKNGKHSNEPIKTDFAGVYESFISGKSSAGKTFKVKVSEYRDGNMKKIDAPIPGEEFYVVVNKKSGNVNIGDKAKFEKFNMSTRILEADASIYRLVDLYEANKSKYKLEEPYQTVIIIDEAERRYAYTGMEIPIPDNGEGEGQVKLIKVDQDGNQIAKAGIEFDIYNINGKKVGHLVTEKDGIATSESLKVGKYKIVETKAPSGYDLDTTPQEVTIEKDKIAEVKFVNLNVGSGQVKLIKVDQNGKQIKESGIEFDILNEKGEKVDHVTTGVDGTAVSKRLPVGKYKVVETRAPTGYEINSTPQEVTLQKDKVAEVKYTNIKVTQRIDIAGVVWLDEGSTKGNDLDYKIGANETKLEGIKVRLYGALGGTKETTTDKNGKYKFEGVPADGIENFNVEFEYNGQKYESIETLKKGAVDQNTGTIRYENTNKYDPEVSKAKEGALDRKNYNNKFSEITAGRTASGIKLNYDSKVENGNKISTIKYDNAEFNIKSSTSSAGIKFDSKDITEEGFRLNVNLGLKKRPEFDLYLYQNMYKSNVKVNNVDGITDYDKRNGVGYDDSGWAKVGVKESAMKEELYSNITKENVEALKEVENQPLATQEQKLQVYLTYVIGVKNESGVVGTSKEIVSYYDDIYQVDNIQFATRNRNNFTVTGEKVKYSDKSRYGNEQQFAGKNAVYIQTEKTLKNNEFYYVLVTVKLKNPAAALRDLYTTGAEVRSINYAEINGYATELGLIDKDSAPGNLDVANYKFRQTAIEDDEAPSPVYIYKVNVPDIPTNDRNGEVTVQGVVWDDSHFDANTNVREGNGIKEDGEDALPRIEVKLFKSDDSLVGSAETDTNGNYSFDKVAPGTYKVQFVYGANEQYNVQDYSSTKVAVETNNKYWYNQTDKIRSSATDDTTKRNEYNSQYRNMTYKNYETMVQNIGTEKIPAYTSEFNIDEGQKGEVNVNFGIAQRPYVKVELNKSIEDVKVKLSNGSFLSNGIREKTASQYIIDKNNIRRLGSVGKQWIEAEDSLIQGSTIFIKYKYTIKNNSETGNGVNGEVQANSIIDYIPNGLAVDTSNVSGIWKQVDISTNELKNKFKTEYQLADGVKLNHQGTVLETDENNELLKPLAVGNEKAVYMQLSAPLDPTSDLYYKFNTLELVNLRNDQGRRDIESIPGKFSPDDATGKATMNSSKELDADSDPNRYDNYVAPSEEISVTPATGQKDINYKITLTALFSGLIMAVGVVLIKKKV